MNVENLTFPVRSGGEISIDLNRCKDCESKACIKVCEIQGGPLVLDKERNVPILRWSLEEIERGGCVECLGCELDCELYGNQAVKITLPLEKFDVYLDSLAGTVVYKG
jgi:succinyl-CoA synthetase beta subunit